MIDADGNATWITPHKCWYVDDNNTHASYGLQPKDSFTSASFYESPPVEGESIGYSIELTSTGSGDYEGLLHKWVYIHGAWDNDESFEFQLENG